MTTPTYYERTILAILGILVICLLIVNVYLKYRDRVEITVIPAPKSSAHL